MLCMPLFGLVQARPLVRSSMWISSVADTSKVLCTSEGASATRTSVRMQDILWLGTNSSWCVPLSRIENVWFLLTITTSQWRNVLFNPYDIRYKNLRVSLQTVLITAGMGVTTYNAS